MKLPSPLFLFPHHITGAMCGTHPLDLEGVLETCPHPKQHWLLLTLACFWRHTPAFCSVEQEAGETWKAGYRAALLQVSKASLSRVDFNLPFRWQSHYGLFASHIIRFLILEELLGYPLPSHYLKCYNDAEWRIMGSRLNLWSSERLPSFSALENLFYYFPENLLPSPLPPFTAESLCSPGWPLLWQSHRGLWASLPCTIVVWIRPEENRSLQAWYSGLGQP